MPPSEDHLERIFKCIERLQKADSPLDKLENLLATISALFNSVSLLHLEFSRTANSTGRTMNSHETENSISILGEAGKLWSPRDVGCWWSAPDGRLGVGAREGGGRGDRSRVHVGSSASLAVDRRGWILLDDLVECCARPQDLQVEPEHYVDVERKSHLMSPKDVSLMPLRRLLESCSVRDGKDNQAMSQRYLKTLSYECIYQVPMGLQGCGTPDCSSVLRILVPDELHGSLNTRTLPVRPNMNTREICRILAHKIRCTNPQDYGLFKLVQGEGDYPDCSSNITA